MATNKRLIDLDGLEELVRELKTKLEAIDLSPSGSVYRPAGNLSSPEVSKLTEENVGKVYNITQEFTTDSEHFVDGSEKKYPAGTDVAVVESDVGVYKFNVLSGFVDLSDYLETKDFQTKFDSSIAAEIADVSEVTEMLKEVFGEE